MTDIATLGLKVDSSGVVTATDRLKKLEKQGARTETSVNSTTKSVGALSGALAGIGAAAVFASLGKNVIAFEKSMSAVEAVSGATAEQLENLSNQARELGAVTVFGANQAADAQKFLSQAGLEVNEVLAATPNLLKLAQAGSLDLAEAADIATNVMSGMRLEVSELSRVNDVLAKTAASSNTNVQQLGQALSFAAPIAATTGVSVEQAAAAIGVLSNNGIQATRAGTGFVGVIRQLSNVTGESINVLERYGISLESVNPEKVGLSAALKTLRAANISTADAFKLFGTEAGAAAQVLINGAEELPRFTKELEDAGGAADRAASIMSDNLDSAIKGLISSFNEVALGVGESSGALKDSIEVITGVVQSYNGLLDVYAESANLSENQLTAIDALSSSASILAVVIGSKLAGGIANATAARVSDTVAAIKQAAANRELLRIGASEAALNARKAASELQQAKNRTANARAIKLQTGNTALLTQAITAEAAANQRNIAATNAATAAKGRYTAAANIAAGASTRLASAMALVGGPAGIAIVAAASLGIYAAGVDEAKIRSQETIGVIDHLVLSLRELSRVLGGTQDQALVESLAGGFAKNTEDRIEEMIENTKRRLDDFREKDASKGLFGKSFTQDIEGSELKLKALEIALDRVKAKSKDTASDIPTETAAPSRPVISIPTKASKEQERFEKQIRSTIESIEFQTATMGLSRAEVVRYSAAVKSLDIDNEELANSYVSVSESLAQAIEDQDELVEAQKKAKDEAEELEKANKKLTDSIGKGLEDAILGYKSFGDTVKGVLDDIARALIQKNITQPLIDSVTGSLSTGSSSAGLLDGIFSLFSAQGNAFDGGKVQAFAKGGIVSQPTAFSHSGGMGLMGEAGTEAILPLKRTSGGDLGVQVAGGSTQGGSVPVIVNVNNQSGGESEVSETQGASGERIINVTILRAVRDAFGSGALDRDLRTNFGISRQGTS